MPCFQSNERIAMLEPLCSSISYESSNFRSMLKFQTHQRSFCWWYSVIHPLLAWWTGQKHHSRCHPSPTPTPTMQLGEIAQPQPQPTSPAGFTSKVRYSAAAAVDRESSEGAWRPLNVVTVHPANHPARRPWAEGSDFCSPEPWKIAGHYQLSLRWLGVYTQEWYYKILHVDKRDSTSMSKGHKRLCYGLKG